MKQLLLIILAVSLGACASSGGKDVYQNGHIAASTLSGKYAVDARIMDAQTACWNAQKAKYQGSGNDEVTAILANALADAAKGGASPCPTPPTSNDVKIVKAKENTKRLGLVNPLRLLGFYNSKRSSEDVESGGSTVQASEGATVTVYSTGGDSDIDNSSNQQLPENTETLELDVTP